MDKLKVAWLYPDFLELYGDRGNIIALKHRAIDLGLELEVDSFSIDEPFIAKEYDLVFLGGGADQDQSLFYNDLLKRKEDFIEGIEDDVVFLLICGGYQLFGEYYIDTNGQIIAGLGIFDFFTKPGEKRSIGYLSIESNIEGKRVILSGFENHRGRTMNVKNPLGEVLAGFGNNDEGKEEGFIYKHVIGTYLHGPLLPRNPELTDIILNWMCKRKEISIDFSKGSDMSFEREAKIQVLKEQNLNSYIDLVKP